MKRLTIVAALALAGCSTVAARREDGPTFTGTTARSLAEFQTCFAAQTDRGQTPTFTPKADGGTYSYTVNRYTMWVVDIADRGADREVKVYSPNSMFGKNMGAAKLVEPCL